MSEDGLPCLITYREKAGGSQFTVSLVADLFLRGSKVLSFTAYDSARENFLQQFGDMVSKTAYVESVDDLQKCEDAQFIMIKSGDESLFLTAMKELTDINERVVLVKNMEVFSQAIFDVCLPLQKIILSGNIDTCVAKKQISKKHYETVIVFSHPETELPVSAPPLEKYSGYLSGLDKEGVVVVQMEN